MRFLNLFRNMETCFFFSRCFLVCAPKKHFGKRCFLNNISSFAGAFRVSFIALLRSALYSVFCSLSQVRVLTLKSYLGTVFVYRFCSELWIPCTRDLIYTCVSWSARFFHTMLRKPQMLSTATSSRLLFRA